MKDEGGRMKQNSERIVRRAALLFFVAFVSPLFAQEKGWEAQWNKIVAEARKEGKVVVMGSADPVVRKELPALFKSKFGVTLEYIGGRGGDNLARLRMERRAGAYTVDASMAGMTNMVEYYQEELLEPLLPALILPEVLDPTKWKKKKLWFVDPGETHVLRLYNYISSGMLYLNREQVKPGSFKSVQELLDPKWRGKISSLDPTISGPGQAEAARFYLQLGEEFVKRLYIEQKPVFSRDKRQVVDWLARGTYPVSISAETEFVVELKKQGLPVDMISLPDAPGTLTAGNGLLALMNRAPHPNAARLFVNWIATKEGMAFLGRARQKPTTRSDIDESYAIPWEVPAAGVSYFDLHNWEFTTTMRDKVNEKVRSIIRAR
jgi:iron(III) transport system substrate-binding protein